MIRDALERILAGETLSRAEAAGLMERLMRGELDAAAAAGLLVAIRARGLDVDEIAGFAQTMRAHAVAVRAEREPLVDTCGTGGDGSGTFNISTAAALVAAGAGAAVAKHGNRAVSSRSGSADVLDALGVRPVPAERAGEVIDRAGIGFLFAPAHHPAMKHVVPVRRALGIRTVFNVLGPLTNPAGVRRQLLGVYEAALTETLARVLGELGSEHVFVVHGADGCDEVSVCADTRVSELRDGRVRTWTFTPESVGLARHDRAALAGGDAAHNAALIERILDGEPGAPRDAVVANAAFVACAAGLCDDVASGVELARRAIDTGAARETLERLRAVTAELAKEAS